MFFKSLIYISLLTSIDLFTSAAAMADSRAEIDTGVHAAEVAFPRLNVGIEPLQQRAYAMLVFPHVAKSGEGVAREYGEGALQVKGQTVGYYSITGASRGVTLGIAYHREVILFMTSAALEHFRRVSHWSVGSDTGVVLVTSGSQGELDASLLKKPILAFVFGESGLFDDLDIQGSSVDAIKR